MKLNKQQRAELKQKFGGHCAYCGELLGDQCQHEWNETTSNGDKYRFFVCKHCDSTRNFEPLEILEHEENHISPLCKVEDV